VRHCAGQGDKVVTLHTDDSGGVVEVTIEARRYQVLQCSYETSQLCEMFGLNLLPKL
jgi:hypothetical protein